MIAVHAWGLIKMGVDDWVPNGFDGFLICLICWFVLEYVIAMSTIAYYASTAFVWK